MAIETKFNQYAYGGLLTMNVDFDPGAAAFPFATLEITSVAGVNIVDVDEGDANLDRALGLVGSVYPVTYKFKPTELDTPGLYQAYLWLRNSAQLQGEPLFSTFFEVVSLPLAGATPTGWGA
jgi:hypothetical protein